MTSSIQSAKLFLVGLIFTAPSAFAIGIFCPELAGDYVCTSGPTQYPVRVVQTTNIIDQRYTFQSPAMGDQSIVTDEVKRAYSTPDAYGSVSGKCDDDHLLATFQFTDANGYWFHVQDSISMDRGALVRVRMSLPDSQVPVSQSVICQPAGPRY